MRYAQVFKKSYFLIALIALIVTGTYQIIKFSPLEQSIIKKVRVNNLANLYITEASAGATTNFSYRYYVFDASKSDADFQESVKGDNKKPFLITDDKNASVEVKENCIYLKIRGRIYSYISPASYRNKTGIFSVPICMESSP
ncbi:hypothetical protein AAGR22_10980 [Erwinia sp. HDF1-3R]|uniref:hypothetical protein n=1 Tax=Erwinia sp. HDF1-3R TaxID=3141543 RepID=UPI0031F4CE42